MVEKFVYTQSSFDEAVEQIELSWKDMQGLSWLLCEDYQVTEKSNSFACT